MSCERKWTMYSFQDSGAFLPNPDRGIYRQVFTECPESIRQNASLDGIERCRLLLLCLDLDACDKAQELSREKLQELEAALELAHQHHFSLIFRAAYGFSPKAEEPGSLALILRHEAQISAVLNRYADMVLCVQAGMLGPYGEWHSSRYLTDGSKYSPQSHQVLMAWLTHLDPQITIALRRPSFLRAAVLMGAEKKRLTVHNDALLANPTDMGTFQAQDRQRELRYIGALPSVYMGGETALPSEFTNIENAVREFKIMGINYLNRTYNQKIWEQWRNSVYRGVTGEEYIIQHLGYRLVLRQLTVEKNTHRSILHLKIQNDGFGRLDGRVSFYLVIEAGGERQYAELENTFEMGELYQFSCPCPDTDGIGVGRTGLLITRYAPMNGTNWNSIALANDSIIFEGGINWFDIK